MWGLGGIGGTPQLISDAKVSITIWWQVRIAIVSMFIILTDISNSHITESDRVVNYFRFWHTLPTQMYRLVS